jgi:hypothetical protein
VIAPLDQTERARSRAMRRYSARSTGLARRADRPSCTHRPSTASSTRTLHSSRAARDLVHSRPRVTQVDHRQLPSWMHHGGMKRAARPVKGPPKAE